MGPPGRVFSTGGVAVFPDCSEVTFDGTLEQVPKAARAVHDQNDGQSLPFALISAARFICSGIISGGPRLKVTLWILLVKRKRTHLTSTISSGRQVRLNHGSSGP